MITQQNIIDFFDKIVEQAAMNTLEIPELTQKASKFCHVKFLMNLVKALEFSD